MDPVKHCVCCGEPITDTELARDVLCLCGLCLHEWHGNTIEHLTPSVRHALAMERTDHETRKIVDRDTPS